MAMAIAMVAFLIRQADGPFRTAWCDHIIYYHRQHGQSVVVVVKDRRGPRSLSNDRVVLKGPLFFFYQVAWQYFDGTVQQSSWFELIAEYPMFWSLHPTTMT
jgi:hypothetical protein